MASNALASTALITFNILFFTLVSSTHHAPTVPIPPVTPPKSVPTIQSPPIAPPNTGGGGSVPPSGQTTCPIDALKLGVCANLLNDLLNLVVGTPANSPCCTLIGGLADLEAAVCLCTAIRANVLGINLNVPTSLSLLLNNCGKNVPSDFQCA
ncbi:hypothetical protein Leryth_001655 [Lithospermum erythrorhizon]|nr:hypothetical protein Leryth_001655 [Lithospermum erythrorhizon]